MTLAYTYAGTVRGKSEVNTEYITSTALDTTATVNGKSIDNRDGRISFISGMIAVSDKTGTSPTLNLILQGSNDGTNFFGMLDDAGNAISSGADSISSSGSGTTIVIGPVDTQSLTCVAFPAFLRWQVAVGGTSTPGWTGVVSHNIIRDKHELR